MDTRDLALVGRHRANGVQKHRNIAGDLTGQVVLVDAADEGGDTGDPAKEEADNKADDLGGPFRIGVIDDQHIALQRDVYGNGLAVAKHGIDTAHTLLQTQRDVGAESVENDGVKAFGGV